MTRVRVGILAATMAGDHWLATCRWIWLDVLGGGQGIEYVPEHAFAPDWREHAAVACSLSMDLADTDDRLIRIEATWQTRSCLTGGSAGLSVALAAWTAAHNLPHPAHVFCSAHLLSDGRVGPGRPDALQAKAEYLDWIWSDSRGYVLIGGSNVRDLVCTRGRALAVDHLSEAVAMVSSEAG